MPFLALRTARWSVCALAVCLVARTALAGDSGAPKQPAAADQARCSALGPGFFAVTGSDACIRISGYVAAGAEFAGGLGNAPHNFGPFEAAPNTALRSRIGASADARFDTPMGPGRIYIEVGQNSALQP